MAVSITQQDKSLLSLIAKGEAKSYNVVYGGEEPSPPLVQRTIAEVMQWQAPLGPNNRPNPRKPSTAAGRYQMLYDTINETTQNLKIDRTQTRFTPEVQDALIINRLESFRKYKDWKALKLGVDEKENSEKFMIQLAMEFASVPVPYALSKNALGKAGPARDITKGQSFYAGDGLNKAHHNPDSFLAALIDIRKGGPGTETPINIEGGTVEGSSGYPAEGTSPLQKMSNFAAGGGFYKRRQGGNADPKNLPAADAVYTYEVIDPLDCLYDFRTGKKVADLSAAGTASISNYNQSTSDTATNTPASEPGVAPADGVTDPATATPADDKKVMDARDKVATQPGRYSDFKQDPNAPAKPVTTSQAPSSSQTPGSTPPKSAPTDGLTGTPENNKSLPTKETAPAKDVSNQPKPEETNKRDMAVKLQADLDKVKRDISSRVSALKRIFDDQVDEYLRDLIDLRDLAANGLISAQQALDSAKTSGNQTAIANAQQAVFSAEGKYKTLDNKIKAGEPYGLSTADKQSRAKADSFYQSTLAKLTTNVNTDLPKIVNQANSLGIQLTQPTVTAQLSSVPPIVNFS